MWRKLGILFFVVVVRPVLVLVLGISVLHGKRLNLRGPAILVANHNSHLDWLVIAALLSWRDLLKARPVAAMDYFMSNRLLAWLSTRVVGIIPVRRDGEGTPLEKLAPCSAWLQQGGTLLFFPEGTRGEPEQLARFKSGIAHLSSAHPEVPVIPVFMHGLGKALPKGESVLVPFLCRVNVGPEVHWTGDRQQFMQTVEQQMQMLSRDVRAPAWD